MIGVITTARDDGSASDKDDECQDDRDDTANHGQNEEAITDALPRGPSKRAEHHRERDVSRCPMNVDTEADDGDEGSWIRRRDCLRDECFRGSCMYENERDGNRGDKEQSGFASYSTMDVRRARFCCG